MSLRKALVLILEAIQSLQDYGGATSRRAGHSLPKGVLTQHLAGKRYLLKAMEAAPLPPPWLHNALPRNVIPPNSEKEAFLSMAWCSELFSWDRFFRLGMDEARRGGRVGKSVWSNMHLSNVLCLCQCSMSVSAFTLQWQS